MSGNTSNYDLQVDIAREIFLKFDQEQILSKFPLEADPDWIYLPYLGSSIRLCRKTGAIEVRVAGCWQECRDYSTVMTVYDLLCHHKGATAPALSGRWCSAGNFIITGITQTDAFTRKTARHFAGRTDALRAACLRLGGELQPCMAGADLTCRFQATPFFPVLLQFWDADEEFPAKVLLLWDENTPAFLHFETTFYLQGDLMARLTAAAFPPPGRS